jgi:hypothetical protein
MYGIPSWKFKRAYCAHSVMDGWMDGGQIWIAVERRSSESSKDVMSISVSHPIWKEEIMLSKMKYQNQNGRQYGIVTQVAIHISSTEYINRQNRRVMSGAEEEEAAESHHKGR